MKNFILFLFIFILGECFSQTYEDSIREMRIIHFSSLMDTSSGILTIQEVAEFEELDYFLIDTNYRIQANFTRSIGKRFKMPTSTSRKPVYRRFGYLDFEIDGKIMCLLVYQNMELKKQKEYKNYLFLPFRDSTSSHESYGGGRYLDLKIPNGNIVLLDFNMAYNPYCAYSIRYSCPIPPKENTLSVPIFAGEKTPKGH